MVRRGSGGLWPDALCQKEDPGPHPTPRLQYQNIDRLVNGALGHNVFNPSLIYIHGPAILEDGSRCMEVLGGVHLVGPVEEEVPCLVSHS